MHDESTRERDRWPDRYRTILEHAADVIFQTDDQGVLEWVSPSVTRLSGVHPDTLVGQHLTFFVADEHDDEAAALRDRLLGGEDISFEGRVDLPDGGTRWVNMNASPVRDDDGVVIGAVGVVRDVDDLVLERQARAANEEMYHLLADHAADAVVRMRPDRIIDWVSPAIAVSLGWQPDEVIGRSADEFFHPDDLQTLAPQRAAMYDREHPRSGTVVLTARLLHRDGTYRWVSGRQVPIVDSDGQLRFVIVGLRDVTDLVGAREELEHANLRLRATLDTLFDPHVLLQAVRDPDGTVIDFLHLEANEAACVFNGASREQLVGATLLDWAPDQVACNRVLIEMFSQVVNTGVPLVLEDWEFPQRNEWEPARRFDVRAVKVDDCVSNSWRDVTDRHHFEARLSHLATHDPLTGLANRAALVDELTRALHAGRRAGRMVGVIMLDLDHFMGVNDSLGHAVGDQLLRAASRRLEAVVRAGDLVSRLGGDEFVIVMRDLADTSEALRVALRIVEEFRLPVTAAGHELHVTASVGVAIAAADDDSEALLRESDTAMYRAKEGGRDRVSIFNDDLRSAASARVTMEAELRPALDLGALAVYYQPEVDLETGRVCAVEALLRWHHPSGELYAADRFIDVAEEIGIIVDSGNWVVREACAQAMAWSSGTDPRHITMRVNLSKQQLAESSLMAAFDRSITESGIDPRVLCVEIAEAALIGPSATVASNLTHLRSRGVRLAIDNFGTGYAALGYLRERPVDMVKIDRSFIRDIGTSDYSRRLVAGITALAHQMGLQVSAEGVETAEQAAFLRSLGCTSAQGFLYSPAVPGTEMGVLLSEVYPTH